MAGDGFSRRRGGLVRLESSTFLSGLGNGISIVVFPWLALESTGSPVAAGLVAAAAALPLVFIGVFAGSLVDMFGRRATAVTSDLLSAVSLAAVPVVDRFTTPGVVWLSLLAIAGAMFDPAGFTARESMLPDAARSAGVRLSRLNGLHEGVFGLAYLLGPGLGGALIAITGPVYALLPAAGAFLVSAVLCAGIRVQGATARDTGGEARIGVWRSTREGLSFVRRDPLLLTLAALSSVVICAWMPIEAVVLPTLFQADDQSGHLGILLMAMSAGSVVGALLYGAIAHLFPRRPIFLCALIGTSAAAAAMAALPQLWVMAGLGLASGLLYGPVNPIVNTAIQERTPAHLRGRTIGTMTSITYAAGPAGFLIAGPLVSVLGVQISFALLGLVMLVAAMSSPFLPALSLLDTPGRRFAAVPEPADPEPDDRVANAGRR